jgi:hypothetical protein
MAEARTDRGRGYRWLHLLNVLLLVALWAFAIVAYPALPERIPAHIGTSGVTRWTERDGGFWFLLPILGTFEAAFVYLVSRIAESGASGINVPQKKRLLALPREAQVYAIEPVRGFMYGMAAWLLLLTGLIQAELYVTAVSGGGVADWFLPLLLAFLLLPFAGVVWLSRAIRVRIDRWDAVSADRT